MHNIPHTQETKDKISKIKRGKRVSIKSEFKKGSVPWNKGKKLPPLSKEHRSKIKKSMNNPWVRKILSNSKIGKFGEKANSWQGGKTKIGLRIRTIGRYTKWRSDVFKRDNYHCQCCGITGYLEVHHIIQLSVIIKEFNIKNTEDAINCNEIWLVDNGITYCQPCHILKDDYRRRFSKKIKVGGTFVDA